MLLPPRIAVFVVIAVFAAGEPKEYRRLGPAASVKFGN